jgi:hypothetical protein
VGFDFAIGFALGIGEADADRARGFYCGVAAAEALAPEVIGLGRAAEDGPVFNHTLPGLAVVGGIVDLIFRR